VSRAATTREPLIRVDELRRRTGAFSRVPLAALPTPLDECPRLSARLGGPRILVKRDDLTGLALGGNKVRKLEFFMADLLDRGTEVVIAGAAKQSNYSRQTAAAAAKLGMRTILILAGEPDAERQGNLLLDDLLGAEIRLRPYADRIEQHDEMRAVAAELVARGVKANVLTGFEPLGSIAYVECVIELLEQCDRFGVRPSHVFLSSGTGTQAGLEVGVRALGLDWKIVGVSADHGLEGYESVSARLAEVANWLCARLDLQTTFAAHEIANTAAYVGAGYGQVTDEGVKAIRLAASCEGLVLDPVYTGKAAAALIDWIRRGELSGDDTVVFLHTGGLPGLFACHRQLTGSA
jgi:D-cysteine desulfhydrase family pyridoxal phosphate-dependent enzyme